MNFCHVFRFSHGFSRSSFVQKWRLLGIPLTFCSFGMPRLKHTWIIHNCFYIPLDPHHLSPFPFSSTAFFHHLPIISPMFEYVWGVLLIFLINHHQIPSPQSSLNYGRYTADSSTFISHIPTIFHIFSTHPLAKNLSGATQGDGSELVGRHQQVLQKEDLLLENNNSFMGMGQNWRPWGTIDLQ